VELTSGQEADISCWRPSRFNVDMIEAVSRRPWRHRWCQLWRRWRLTQCRTRPCLERYGSSRSLPTSRPTSLHTAVYVHVIIIIIIIIVINGATATNYCRALYQSQYESRLGSIFWVLYIAKHATQTEVAVYIGLVCLMMRLVQGRKNLDFSQNVFRFLSFNVRRPDTKL